MRGQNLTELALVIGIVGLVFISMQVYIARGIQGKLKDLTDSTIGSEQSAYTQDVSGYALNISDSSVSIRSKTRLTDSMGGGKDLVSVEPEITTENYSSKSVN